MIWRLTQEYAGYASEEARFAGQRLHEILYGEFEVTGRLETCFQAVEARMAEAVSAQYVRHHVKTHHKHTVSKHQ